VGVLKLLEKGEIDDKIICVLPDSPLGVVHNLSELEEHFPGITDILETWFVNYKGRNRLKSLGLAGLEEARRMIQWAAESFASRIHAGPKAGSYVSPFVRSRH
jgi:inorganic pyrophosphatase